MTTLEHVREAGLVVETRVRWQTPLSDEEARVWGEALDRLLAQAPTLVKLAAHRAEAQRLQSEARRAEMTAEPFIDVARKARELLDGELHEIGVLQRELGLRFS